MAANTCMKVAAALTVLSLAFTCVAVDAVKVTADGQIEYVGRFAGRKTANCDVGALSRIVMHLGSGIAIQQGLLRQDPELDALVDRMMSDLCSTPSTTCVWFTMSANRSLTCCQYSSVPALSSGCSAFVSAFTADHSQDHAKSSAHPAGVIAASVISSSTLSVPKNTLFMLLPVPTS